MSSGSRKIIIIAVSVVVVIGGYTLVRFTQGSSGVPAEFTNARMQGALISEDIVHLSNQSTAELEQIDTYDKSGQYAKALNLTTNIISQSDEIRTQAVALSSQIANMTKALSNISDMNARQAALSAISDQLAMMNQLVSYSADLNSLLEALQNRFTGKADTGPSVAALVTQINTDVNAINGFNNQAATAMNQFDSLENK